MDITIIAVNQSLNQSKLYLWSVILDYHLSN